MNLWRAPTENDGLKLFMDLRGIADFEFYCKDKAMYLWLDAGLDSLRFSLADLRADREARKLKMVHEVSGGSGRRVGRFVQDWNFEAVGPRCDFTFDLDAGLPELPKIGLSTALLAGHERVRWYGRGPHECYADRKAGAALGIWESSVDGLQVPYVLPQENGNRTDTRWVEALGEDGSGLRVTGIRGGGPGSGRGGGTGGGSSTFDFTASHHEAGQLWKARHTSDLVRRKETFLAIDVAQRGLGTASCGPDTLERYRLRPGLWPFSLSFAVLPGVRSRAG
jgi:beta-galactosidase